ncbi:cyclic-phosphate processing receiver domain-containing protein [Sulfuricurvum sp.]|uniref:cyclic-phosphate processing receiver domain-containing protein n=1 Tax=Sulfuricurvum sp. TaxID=2025608 RepID=UPI002605D00B|nr:cyclic-phosphate processing receiver domain-containing protein [Sulfuricurvum sp.]MDD3595219.1 hypothetical protein [Sulfuricurvum sp.]
MSVKHTIWKLYLDDIRYPNDNTYIIARTVEEAQQLIEKYGVPEYISFDHDLGVDDMDNLLPNGYDLAKWLVEMDMDGNIELSSDFTFTVHSQNPVGAENIRVYLSNYLAIKR